MGVQERFNKLHKVLLGVNSGWSVVVCVCVHRRPASAWKGVVIESTKSISLQWCNAGISCLLKTYPAHNFCHSLIDVVSRTLFNNISFYWILNSADSWKKADVPLVEFPSSSCTTATCECVCVRAIIIGKWCTCTCSLHVLYVRYEGKRPIRCRNVYGTQNG